jgi:hypothetical protein
MYNIYNFLNNIYINHFYLPINEYKPLILIDTIENDNLCSYIYINIDSDTFFS